MTDEGNPRALAMRLTQELIVEGERVRGTFVGQHGMHATDVEALTQLLLAEQLGNAMTPGTLAEELRLTTGAVTALVDRLERAGHLARVRDPGDRRRVLLQVSDRGRALTGEYLDPIRRRTHEVMDQFAPEDLDVVIRYLTATTAAMAEHRREMLSAGRSKRP